MKTNEGSFTNEHSLDHALEFFSKGGSAFEKAKKFYAGSDGDSTPEKILSLFIKSWIVDKILTLKILFWVRNVRGGAGNRSGFRTCMNWLAQNEPDWVVANITQIPELGRWDDLECLYNTKVESYAVAFWVKSICEGNGLAAKWAGRKDNKLIAYFRNNILKEKNHKANSVSIFRKVLVSNTKVVETQMCAQNWSEINYQHVPSVAMARYTKAFFKHDESGMLKFKEALVKGEAKINASVLFPHDCVRTVDNNGDAGIADAQFAALPNYLEGTDQRIMCLADSSGSMDIQVSGSVKAVDISKGLSLYCSDKVGKSNPFYRKFMIFESESKLVSWESMTFSQAVKSRTIFDGACGSTRIDKAIMSLLSMGKMFKATKDQMPNVLLVISDMQFSQGVSNARNTEVETCMQEWDKAGFARPKIIYWNLSTYTGSQATKNDKNIALISGFSPSLLTSVFQAKDFGPMSIMKETVDKYEVFEPKKKLVEPTKMFKTKKFKVENKYITTTV